MAVDIALIETLPTVNRGRQNARFVVAEKAIIVEKLLQTGSVGFFQEYVDTDSTSGENAKT